MTNSFKDTILSFDLGTTAGWASIKDGVVSSGTQNFNEDRFSGAGYRYYIFRKFLDQQKKDLGKIDLICFEEVMCAHKGSDAARVYGAFFGVLTSWCEEMEIPYTGVPISHIKIFSTGKGNASKNEVINGIIRRGYSPSDHNEADALALLLFVVDDGHIKSFLNKDKS